MRFEKIVITQIGSNKSPLLALLVSNSPGRTVAEVARAAETHDLWEISALIARSAQEIGSS
jgi:hypothetical protein